MSTVPSGLKTGWWSFQLPKYRPHPKFGTYSLFSYQDLPPIREKLDDDFRWLESQPTKKHSLIEGCYGDGSKPDLSKLALITAQLDVAVPQALLTFINSINLHEKIRSCTDCYLDVADYAVKTKGAVEGYLIHFLSDSQWCGHWYVHVDHSGRHFVVVSLDAYGFAHTGEAVEIDLAKEEVWFCAPTLTEFIYRFWLENEIWFALMVDKRPLSRTEQEYVDHYLAPPRSPALK